MTTKSKDPKLLSEHDFEVIGEFKDQVERLRSNNTISKTLDNRIRGILPELLVVNKLHSKFKDRKIWLESENKKGYDIMLEKPNGERIPIQIKKMTGYKEKYNNNISFWHWDYREDMEKGEYYKVEDISGFKLKLFPDKLPEDLAKKFEYPYVFVYTDTNESSFFIVSKSEMKEKAYEYIRDGKNNWLRNSNKKSKAGDRRAKEQGNIREAWLVFFKNKHNEPDENFEFKKAFYADDCLGKWDKLLE